MVKTIEISDETFEKLKDQLVGDGYKEIHNYEDLIGQKIFFRTVTYFALGEVKKIVGRFVHLKNASMIADTGRFNEFLKDGLTSTTEVEPTGEQFLNMDTVVDFFIWKHALPNKVK